MKLTEKEDDLKKKNFTFERTEKIQNLPILVLFLLSLIWALSFSIYVFPNCSPWHSYYGTDSWGNICSSLSHSHDPIPNVTGSGRAMFGKDFVWALNFFATSTECLANQTMASDDFVKICVASCPNAFTETNAYNNCLTILQENDYESQEFVYAQTKCQSLHKFTECSRRSVTEANGNQSNSEYV